MPQGRVKRDLHAYRSGTTATYRIIVQGTLTLASDSQTVTVGAGECLLGEVEPEASHPLLGLSAGVCPMETTPTPTPDTP